MFVIFGVLSFMLFLIAFILLRRTPQGILLTIDNLFIIGCSILFGVMFPITYYYSINHDNNVFLREISKYGALELFLYYICVSIFMILYVYFFRLMCSENATLFKEERKSSKIRDEHILISAVILLLVGVVADYLYCSAYGGYLGYLQYSAYIRSGITDMIPNRWSFLIIFRDCIVISSYLFCAQIKKDGVVRIGRLALFIISFVMSIMVLYANKGRISLMVYLVVLFLTWWIHKKKVEHIKLKQIATIGIFAVAFLWGFMGVSELMDRASGFSPVEALLNEVSFCFSNFKVLINNMEVEDVRLFVDIISYPLFLLPSSLWIRIFPNTASDIMTIFVFGSQKGVGDVYGEVPIDAISFGYIQLGIFGVCVVAVLAGIISAILYKLIDKMLDNKIRLVIITYISVDIILRSLLYADSYGIVQRCFSLIVFALIYWGIGLFYGKNKYTQGN